DAACIPANAWPAAIQRRNPSRSGMPRSPVVLANTTPSNSARPLGVMKRLTSLAVRQNVVVKRLELRPSISRTGSATSIELCLYPFVYVTRRMRAGAIVRDGSFAFEAGVGEVVDDDPQQIVPTAQIVQIEHCARCAPRLKRSLPAIGSSPCHLAAPPFASLTSASTIQ